MSFEQFLTRQEDVENNQEIQDEQDKQNENLEKEERESLEKISRREFLQKLATGAIVLGLGGFEFVLSSGCATRKIGLENEEINKGLEYFAQKLEDPNGYLDYLEDREFVIKNEIFDSYARTIDKRPEWLNNPVGGYMSENYLDTKEEQEEFKKRLSELGLSQNEIEFYESFFTSSDLIIFKESILKDKFFLKALPHERFHKMIKHANNEEYKIMEQAAEEIIRRTDKNNNLFVNEKYYEGKFSSGFYVMAANMNWEEFYTYLAQGEFEDKVEETLKKDYPEVYVLFNKIKESCKLKEQE